MQDRTVFPAGSLLPLAMRPGLHFLLDMPPGLTHAWPDLDTYPAVQMKEELEQLGEGTVVIFYKKMESFPGTVKKCRRLWAGLIKKIIFRFLKMKAI